MFRSGAAVFPAPMDAAKRIDRRLGFRHFHFELFVRRQFFDREIAPALQGQRMGGVQNGFDFFQADARVFDVVAHAVGMALKRFDGVFGPGRAEGEVVFEKIVVAINMRDRQHLQARGCCRA